jgi:uncharacterized protein (TIGR03435 family)
VRERYVTSGALALAAIVACQAQTAPRPEFEVASIRQNKDGGPRVFLGEKSPGTFSAENASLWQLIQRAYGVTNQRPGLPFEIAPQQGLPILGGPSWLGSARFDISAKWTPESAQEPQAQLRLRVQTLLEQRFRLMLHRETKDLPVYELTMLKGAAKLRHGTCITFDPLHPQPPIPPGEPPPNYCGNSRIRRQGLDWTFDGTAISMADLAGTVGMLIDQHRTVVDKTGFGGKFDVHLQWTPGLGELGEHDLPVPPEGAGASIFSVLADQLGLKLKAGHAPVEVLVIDHAEMPSAN